MTNIFRSYIDTELDWFALTMYAPYDELLLLRIKTYETRSRGVRSPLPLILFIQTAQKPLDDRRRSLADKYLAKDYHPNHGKIIGCCKLTATTVMTQAFINQQTPQELEVGIWEVGRVAWACENCIFLPEAIAVKGSQAAPWHINRELKQEIISKNTSIITTEHPAHL